MVNKNIDLTIKIRTNINGFDLEIRKFQDRINIMAINPINEGHKISKFIEIDQENITENNLLDFVSEKINLNDFVERARNMFSDPNSIITE